jgi:hypothetical protein
MGHVSPLQIDTYLYRRRVPLSVGRTMQNTWVADLLIPFCEAGSLNVRDVSRAVRKRILVSLSFADLQDLHAKLFSEHHMDWAGVNEYLQVMRCEEEEKKLPLKYRSIAGCFFHRPGLDADPGARRFRAGDPLFCRRPSAAASRADPVRRSRPHRPR